MGNINQLALQTRLNIKYSYEFTQKGGYFISPLSTISLRLVSLLLFLYLFSVPDHLLRRILNEGELLFLNNNKNHFIGNIWDCCCFILRYLPSSIRGRQSHKYYEWILWSAGSIGHKSVCPPLPSINILILSCRPVIKDRIGKFWVATAPAKDEM